MASEETTEEAQGQLRALNLNMVTASISTVGALLMAIGAETAGQIAVLGVGLMAALIAITRWGAGRLLVSLSCLLVTAAVWTFGVLLVDNATPAYNFALVGAVVVHQMPRHRRAVIAGLAAFVAAVLVARLAVSDWDFAEVLLKYLVVTVGVGVSGVVLAFLHQRVSVLIMELERARERDAELAVVRERIRFASDLHDIQGHTLHVVKLKTALAQKLLHSDIGRVEEELREVHALVGDTITQTKELAYAQRRLNLSAELENAKNLFSAAGIRVRVDREGEAGTGASELLGQVLRETTTNILRHAQAEQVEITLSESGISIVNDGAREDAPPEFRGLATLRDRVAGEGGRLTAEQQDGRFLTAAEFPPRPDAAR
ncbi:two-component system sensor histidine kinase DesK [Murinocardiopsis flavida]|uniref:Two-component system sensor histidine kinase DesK n=1 Tax=Murinocardiopsis flavida TaxID=645275 RepID=A0A2P8DGG5_9ACTN|nr:histidine kinase [Murinocardiopsis flavida]PSK96279.1 two-component system sensor histidine kinase DesK [Murinocardiopsis flavida]